MDNVTVFFAITFFIFVILGAVWIMIYSNFNKEKEERQNAIKELEEIKKDLEAFLGKKK